MISTFFIKSPHNHNIDIVEATNSIRNTLEELGLCVESPYPNIRKDIIIQDYCFGSVRHLFSKIDTCTSVALLNVDIVDFYSKKMLAVKVLYV